MRHTPHTRLVRRAARLMRQKKKSGLPPSLCLKALLPERLRFVSERLRPPPPRRRRRIRSYA